MSEDQTVETVKVDKTKLSELLSDLDSQDEQKNASSGSITIKKRKPKNRNAAKISVPVVAETEEDEIAREQLEQVKFLQKMRGRYRGAALVAEGDNTAGGVTDIAEGSGEEKMMATSFQQEVNISASVDAQMEKYIQEQLAARRGQKRKTDEPESSSSASSSSSSSSAPLDINDDSTLYQTPEYLKAQSSTKVEDDMEESGERWLTGISEVSLPISHKLEVIEKTEMAKRQLFEKKQADKDKRSAISGPANYSANFRQHQREYESKRREKMQADGQQSHHQHQQQGDGAKVPTASDDRVVAGFIKRMRGRKNF